MTSLPRESSHTTRRRSEPIAHQAGSYGSSMSPVHVEGVPVGFMRQYTATLRRQLLQKSRMPGSWAIEMVLPLVFVVGIILVSLTETKKEYPSKQFVTADNDVTALGPDIRAAMCYTSANTTDAGLRSLLSLCPFDRSTIPTGSTCLTEDLFHIVNSSAHGVCVTSRAIIDKMTEDFGFTQQFGLLSFDDMVLLQLMARVVLGGPSAGVFGSVTVSTSLKSSGKLYFTPQSATVDRVVGTLRANHQLMDLVYGGTYASSADVTNTIPEGETWGIVNVEEPSSGISLLISLNYTATPGTNQLRPQYEQGGLDKLAYTQYWASGFLTLQQTLYDTVLNNGTISTADAATTPVFDKTVIGLVPMGYTDYTKNIFLLIAAGLAPLLLVLAYLYPVSQVAKRFVEEKELRLREGTMIMGLGKSAFFCSWLTIYHAQTILLGIVIALLLKLTVMPGSDWFLIFVTFTLFGIGAVHLAAMLATLFSSSKVTALVVPLLYFAMAIPSFAIPDGTADGAYVFLSLFCPIPFSVGLKLMFGYENNNGMGWADLSSATDTPMNMGGVLGYLVLDIVIYTVLMLYFDLVIPKQWGTTHHPCFCFTLCCTKKNDYDDEEALSADSSAQTRPWLSRSSHLVQRQLETDRANGNSKTGRGEVNDVVVDTVQEYPLPTSQATVHIKRVMKVFDAPAGVKEKNVAVNKFDMCLYPNSITVLLGHNGAGKTTVMNMITGMLNMSSGDVEVYGDSVSTSLQAVRRKVGYCPQHNILWDDLTCIEHLEYFGRLKGMSGTDLSDEVDLLLREVDLTEKANNRSHELSGGQKRKLSVAIAFMGGSSLVLLDEPTAGMDVGARRHTWELLKEMSSKNNRTVLLTTHFMDEADLLGSRIAIMSKGELESYGTSTFLKNKLGTGYVMKIASTEAFNSPDAILDVVHRTIPVAEVKECKGQELTIALPKSHIREFAGVIRLLESEDMRRMHKISTISMSVSTLEDVFVQLALDEELRGAAANRLDANSEDSATVPVGDEWLQTLEKVYKKQLERAQRVTNGVDDGQTATSAFMRQLTGLILKRINNAKRDYRTLFLQIALPLIIIIFAMGMGELPPPGIPQLNIVGSMYGTSQLAVMNGCDPSIVSLMPGYNRIDTSNVSTYNASVDLVATADFHGDHERFGAVSCNQPGNMVLLNGSNTASSTFTTILVNGSGYHQAPLMINQLYAASIRHVRGNTAVPVSVSSLPMPRTARQLALIEGVSSIIVTIFILIPFTFIPSTYVGYAVKEKETKSKHLQFVSGVHYLAYWLANFIFDTVCFLVTMSIALIIFAVFGRSEFVGGSADTFFATLVLLLFYGISGITSAYAISFLFDNHSTAQNMVMFGNFIAGFMLVLIVYMLDALSDSGKSVTDVLKWFFRFIPSYCLGDGLMQLAAAKSDYDINHVHIDPFGTEVIAYDLVYMGLMSVVYFALVLFIDNPGTPALLHRLRCWGDRTTEDTSVDHCNELDDEERKLIADGEDADVSQERKAIRSGGRNEDAVRVNRIRKVYGNGKVAVRSLTFGVKKGEVFGFLGTNGAGKTTTMSMLTGEFAPSSGGAMVGAYDVVENARDAQRIIGYCPQFDAVMELMTPYEHLMLYAALRLVPAGDETSDLIDALLVACDLIKYRDIPSGNLSGGNRRKLSIAIALVGGPEVVFLDEPSAGIDPAARRQLFDVISFIATQSAVVLTTHHLEEVDVLAHRVGIMDRGAMKCLGSLEHLKTKYGDGIEITLQASSEGGQEADNVLKAKRFMETTFPKVVLSEERQQRLLYVLPFAAIKLSDLFETVMDAVDSGAHGIKDYTIQQSSLEQVFLRIARLGEGDANQELELSLSDDDLGFMLPDSASRRKRDRAEKDPTVVMVVDRAPTENNLALPLTGNPTDDSSSFSSYL